MDSRHACFWTGPVSANQVADVKWSVPTDVVTVGKGVCGQKEGDTRCVSWQSFTALAASLPSGDGKTKLDALLSEAGLQGPYDRSVASGFSAGGAFLEGLCSDKATSDQLDAVLSLDSWYFGGAPPGLMAYLDRAVSENGLLVVTTSGAEDYGFNTPEVQFKPVLAKIGAEDMDPQVLDSIFAGAPMPKPTSAHVKGSLFHFGWGRTLFHTDHAKLVGPYLLGSFVSPYLAALSSTPAPPEPTPGEVTPVGLSWLWWLLGGSAALAGGFFGTSYVKRRWFSGKKS